MANKYKNRIDNLRRDQDTIRNSKISIEDVDNAIVGHMKNTITPTIIENGVIRKVPIIFANPETWKGVQEFGWYRDGKSRQIMVPVMVVKNTGLSKQSTIPVDKLDGNVRKTVSKQWDKKNRYDIFSVYNNIKPAREYYSVTVPDYLIFTYQVQIWTAHITQMNGITEKFIYAENSYWGGSNFKFRASYDSIANSIEMTDGENRAVRNTFDMNVYAYILPESYNNQNTGVIKLNPAKILITAEFDHGLDSRFEKRQRSIPVSIDEAKDGEELFEQFVVVDGGGSDFISSGKNYYVKQ